MIEVSIHSALDDYHPSDFPKMFPAVPRKGDFIEVKNNLKSSFSHFKLPLKLEVKNVYWKYDEHGCYPELDLWYSETDFKLYFPDGFESRKH